MSSNALSQIRNVHTVGMVLISRNRFALSVLMKYRYAVKRAMNSLSRDSHIVPIVVRLLHNQRNNNLTSCRAYKHSQKEV